MAKSTGTSVVQMLWQTRDDFTKLRQEFHAEVVGQRRFTEARFSLIKRRSARVEAKKS